MVRGFTLLELLLSISVLAVLVSLAVPAFGRLTGTQEMTALAVELQSFITLSKSEAARRNQDMWAHIVFHPSDDSEEPRQWQIILTDGESLAASRKLQVIQGRRYSQLVLYSEYTADQIKFDGVRGKVKNGHLWFHPEKQPDNVLVLKTSYGASRTVICGREKMAYGYPVC